MTTNMTNLTAVMQDNQLKATSAQLSASTAIREIKAKFDERAASIKGDRHLTGEGRGHQITTLRADLEAELKATIAKLKAELDEADNAARQAARAILTTSEHPQPSDGERALFERDLTDLQTKLLLEQRYNSAMQLITDFTAKYEGGYYASTMLGKMPSLIETVVALADNKDEARASLKRLYATLSDRAKTVDQREAETVLAREQPTLISRGGIDYGVVLDLFGAHTAYEMTKGGQ